MIIRVSIFVNRFVIPIVTKIIKFIYITLYLLKECFVNSTSFSMFFKRSFRYLFSKMILSISRNCKKYCNNIFHKLIESIFDSIDKHLILGLQENIEIYFINKFLYFKNLTLLLKKLPKTFLN